MSAIFYRRIISTIIVVTLPLAYGDVGGHEPYIPYVSALKDLYASSMQIEILWENDIGFVKLIESIKEKWKDGPKSFGM